MTDKQKRDAAVDAFAEKMKARLDEKADEGYVGWNTIPRGLCNDRIVKKSVRMGNTPYLNSGVMRSNAVDIANIAMMMEYDE